MHLKTLTLKGFKSFAEPASIRFEPGVSVVVGPNGSGKSNVVDAIAWVLGAQAPSAVRSARMDDVIFAGTSRKSALHRAEVTLTIDNSDGALPLALSEVSITRVLTSGGDSGYALNGRPCRLLDIAELLSDTGVGRQQHVIVSQSQIDAVLNARADERREIIEEAAGVLKFRKRRERAERRLLSSDGDLNRINDLVREVRRRLRPLERQAEAARWHADMLAEMQALRVHLAVQEITGMRQRLRGHRSRADLRSGEQAEFRAELDALALELSDKEQRLARHGVMDDSERLARLEGLRARAGGLEAVLEERSRSIERERAALAGRDLAAGLSSEITRCKSDLEMAEAAARAAEPARRELERMQQRLEQDRARFDAEWGDVDAGADADASDAADAARARGELAVLRSTLAEADAERGALAARLQACDERLVELAEAIAEQRLSLSRGEEQVAPARESSSAAADAHSEAQAALERAVNEGDAANEERRRWSSRHEALLMALRDSAEEPPDGLADAVEGVVGPLRRLVTVEAGAEAAFAAAVGEAVSAIVVRDAQAARRLLARLASSDAGAAAISLQCLQVDEAAVRAVDAACERSLGAEPLRRSVSGRGEVARLLDALLASVVVVDGDWSAAADLAVGSPELIFVTRAGDRLSRGGWRLGVHARAGLLASLHEASERQRAATASAERAEAVLQKARSDLSARSRGLEEARDKLAAAESAASAVAEALSRAESERRDLDASSAALREHFAHVERRVADSAQRCELIEARLPALEAAAGHARQRRRSASAARSELERRALDLAHSLAGQRAADASLQQQRALLRGRLAELEERLVAYESTRAAAADRLDAMRREWRVLETLKAALEKRASVIDTGLAEIRLSHRQRSEQAAELARTLDDLRRRRSDVERRVEDLSSEAARAGVEEAEVRTLLQSAVERLRDDYGLSPAQAAEQRLPVLPEGVDAAARADHLSAELDVMGPVNPLALAEYEELSERYELLRGQLDDVRAARRDLNGVIRSIDAEIQAVFGAAFADVAANFEVLFESLFPGGEGRLILTEPDDLLNTGIDVLAKPSGKNVKRLSLLSGGERTLAALALLFAVFRSRPSPFYVMDEVEAALDDVNLHRFLKLIDEFRVDAQLVIVTHQKRTMEAADCLQGVSMKPGGSSVVVSERVANAA